MNPNMRVREGASESLRLLGESRSPDLLVHMLASAGACAHIDWVQVSSWAKSLCLQAAPALASAFPSIKWAVGKMKLN